jgi:hypothetical protein
VETITDYLVEQVEPKGYLTSENVQWLIERIGRDGRVDTKTELELLVNVLDKARWVPQSLARFALEQVKNAVISGSGPLRSGKQLEPGIVSQCDVELLRRIIFAAASDGCIAVTQMEAEMLFEIDEITAGRDNHPAWTDLFVKAIANCVMAASGYAPPPREVALAHEACLDRRGDLSLEAILGGIGSGLRGLFAGYRERTLEESAIARLTQQKVEIITHEAIEAADAAWLAQRIGRDGKITPNELALLMFLKTESPSIDPTLWALVDRAGLSL